MKKRMISALLAFAVAVGGAYAPLNSGAFAGSQSIKASAWIEPGTETFKWGDYTCYYLDDGTICVADCDENVILAVVPPEMDGVKVTKIGNLCFSSCKALEAGMPCDLSVSMEVASAQMASETLSLIRSTSSITMSMAMTSLPERASSMAVGRPN